MSLIEKMLDGLKPKDNKTAIISYRTTVRNKELLHEIARNDGKSVNALIGDALYVYFKQRVEKLDHDTKVMNEDKKKIEKQKN